MWCWGWWLGRRGEWEKERRDSESRGGGETERMKKGD